VPASLPAALSPSGSETLLTAMKQQRAYFGQLKKSRPGLPAWINGVTVATAM
jgi:hypothetical protein